ncbi:MAG: valine--tRNA ligase [Candidatus Peribacteraceae bacterium]|nr:valine--tRNA ligase [Candidatus Peribacteraceae bacterium]
MLPKAYDPKAVEDGIYAMWEQSGAFKADTASKKEPFTISMPPPNATGQLHLGHAVMLALEDIFIRFARMQGKEALWVPGTDHAAIATESVVIKKIQQEEKIPDPRAKLGREELIRRIADFVGKSQDTIRSQIRKMGASCDWSRERYTFDPALNRCVNEVFVKMYKDGLIYRGHRIVNWDPKMQTTVADDEIEYVEETVPFYTFQYGPFQISTARPETKFGDKYVVVHPDDKRYKQYKDGEQFECEWIGGKIKATIIKDKVIDMEFGTGCMTITPWHDPVDFDLAERHKLDKEQIIDFEGKLLPIAGEFAGMSIEEARPKIVEKLKEKGLFVKIEENYVHRVAVSYRGKGKIEPQIKEQWFIDVNKPVVPWKKKNMSLKEVMQDVIRSKEIEIIPDRFEKVYFHWIDNLRDWCISRQIWWGHRVPVYYCKKCTEIVNGKEVPMRLLYIGSEPFEVHEACGSPVTQDPDTLDTWFSSGLWTWSTLIDPALTEDYSLDLPDLLKKSPDYQKFHPTTVMETGYDILFFWVARMILMTTYATGQIPFKKVYLHGLIRTRDGAKMSKSHPETCIDPLEIIPKYGADALRLSMIVGQSPGNDSRLFEEKIGGYRNFVNKLWNASRFVLIQCEEAGLQPNEKLKIENEKLSLADKALLSALQDLITDVTEGLETYRLSEVGERLYSFVWDYFCDWYLELSKGEANPQVLIHALRTMLQLLHPYCPFVTEELWKSVAPRGATLLIKGVWPQADDSPKNQGAFDQLQVVIDVITALRSIRAEQGVDQGKKIEAIIHTKEHVKVLESQRGHIERMGRLEKLTIDAKSAKHKNAASVFLKGVEVHIPLEGMIDMKAEKQKLTKEQENLRGFLAGVEKKLSNEQFIANAAAEVVAKEKQKLADAQEKLRKVEERLKLLS